MYTVGITGSVAMGKSTVVRMVRFLGHPVFDADAAVARLYREDVRLCAQIAKVFPEAADFYGVINKAVLTRRVFQDVSVRNILEEIIHPGVRRAAKSFVNRHRRLRRKMVFWDVPLMFQSGMDQFCTEVWVVSCSETLQHRRVLRRAGWDEERWKSVCRIQLSSQVQERLADRVIPTGLGRAITFRHLKRGIAQL